MEVVNGSGENTFDEWTTQDLMRSQAWTNHQTEYLDLTKAFVVYKYYAT